jgi:hypothetical protein
VTTPRDAKPKAIPVSLRTTDRTASRPAGAGPSDANNAVPADRRLAWLDRMRPFRARHERDVSMEAALQSLERQLREQHNAVGDIIDVWNEIVPAPLQGIASIGGISQGTLTLVCATSGASYEISRALRDGLERTLMQRLPSRVKRIKVRVA